MDIIQIYPDIMIHCVESRVKSLPVSKPAPPDPLERLDLSQVDVVLRQLTGHAGGGPQERACRVDAEPRWLAMRKIFLVLWLYGDISG